MKGRLNCWEYKKCGRQPGGMMADELGICPVSTATYADGLNRGVNGGRICWAIKGRFDGDDECCMKCGFFTILEHEEAENRPPLKKRVADVPHFLEL